MSDTHYNQIQYASQESSVGQAFLACFMPIREKASTSHLRKKRHKPNHENTPRLWYGCPLMRPTDKWVRTLVRDMSALVCGQMTYGYDTKSFIRALATMWNYLGLLGCLENRENC